jgi:gluconolactonase
MKRREFLGRLGGTTASLALGSVTGCRTAPSGPALWTPRPMTLPGEFTPGIEGPAADRFGNVYAVNYQRQQTIGRITPDGRGEVFVELPGTSTGNGIVFDRANRMFVADYVGHQVLRIDLTTREIVVHAHEPRMNQPNDLAIARDGTLYASDPNWKNGTGQLWRIDTDGTVTRLAEGMGTTNGLDLSPDERTLYVNESVQRNLWAFPVGTDRRLGTPRLVRRFPDHGFDGMRVDAVGQLHVTRHGEGVVAVLTPAGEILRKVPVLGLRPTNLCFGGADGRSVFVTEVDHTRLVTYRADQPGRTCWWRNGA